VRFNHDEWRKRCNGSISSGIRVRIYIDHHFPRRYHEHLSHCMTTIHDILSIAWPDRGGWRVDGDLIAAGDGGQVPTIEEIEAQRAFADSVVSARQAAIDSRASGRSALYAEWQALPAYIRGPFREKFEVANKLLDELDDEAAIAMIDYAEAPESFTADQILVFQATKTAMKAGIENL